MFLLQVVEDHESLELDGVFQLIAEGEILPVYFSKELEVIWPFREILPMSKDSLKLYTSIPKLWQLTNKDKRHKNTWN